MNWVAYGPHALLFRFADQVGEEALARQRGIVADLERHPPSGLIEFVPAFTTILLEFDPKIVPEPEQIAADIGRGVDEEHDSKRPVPGETTDALTGPLGRGRSC